MGLSDTTFSVCCVLLAVQFYMVNYMLQNVQTIANFFVIIDVMILRSVVTQATTSFDMKILLILYVSIYRVI